MCFSWSCRYFFPRYLNFCVSDTKMGRMSCFAANRWRESLNNCHSNVRTIRSCTIISSKDCGKCPTKNVRNKKKAPKTTRAAPCCLGGKVMMVRAPTCWRTRDMLPTPHWRSRARLVREVWAPKRSVGRGGGRHDMRRGSFSALVARLCLHFDLLVYYAYPSNSRTL